MAAIDIVIVWATIIWAAVAVWKHGKWVSLAQVPYFVWALSTVREFMEDDGQSFAYQKFIAPASASVTFAKALNRSVTGSMNDYIQGA